MKNTLFKKAVRELVLGGADRRLGTFAEQKWEAFRQKNGQNPTAG